MLAIVMWRIHMPRFAVSGSKLRHGAIIGGMISGLLAAALMPTAFAQAPAKDSIPNFASKDFGWQQNEEDWQDPPPGSGHGPIRENPAYPFVNNADGNRTHTQVNVRITNTKDPILKPWAAAQIEATNQEVLSGKRPIPFTSQSRCWPGGVPGQLLYPFEPFYAIQTPKEVWMIWQRDHMVRRIFLTNKHSPNVKPSWFGESIGHYENGDTLVVDTIGLSTQKNSYIDNFRTPHSEKLHVVERFTIGKDGKSLTAVVNVEDPDTFNAPITLSKRWFKVDLPMIEVVCSENNDDHFNQNLFPIPIADKPDF
jgi:hypothetical protein